ncbi:MAG TPA: rhomboid family intramembrane serine protease [Gemmatimonadales bacterium]
MTPVVRALLFANVGVFFLQNTMPALARAFVFVPQLALLRPWSIVTYMFLHGSFMHILFNMIALYFFGPRVEERIGSRQFTILYFLSGITGALLSFVFAPSSPIIGASGAVFGVMLAFAYFWPHVQIFIWGILPIPARMLVIITTVLALWGGFGSRGGGIAHFAHLGGYVGAFLYLKWMDRKRHTFKRRVQAAPPEAAERAKAYDRIDMSRIHEVNREEVNRILDKISAKGVGSLTPQERVFLSNFVPPDDRVPPKT